MDSLIAGKVLDYIGLPKVVKRCEIRYGLLNSRWISGTVYNTCVYC